MLLMVATVSCRASLLGAVISFQCESPSTSCGRGQSKRNSTCGLSRGSVTLVRRGHGGRGVCIPLHSSSDETCSDPGTSSDESLNSSTTIGRAHGEEQNKAPFSQSQQQKQEAIRPRNGSEGGLEGSSESSRLRDFSLLQTRRFWLGTSVGFLAALGGNLGGLTSSILNLDPLVSKNIRADLLFPVKGFKRCMETSQGFEFVYPMSWVGDQRLLYRAVDRAERERSLDLPPIQRRQQQQPPAKRGLSGVDPIVAFGPPGTDGELNVSVVVAPVYPGFTLQKIGGPQEAGQLILKQFIAPQDSKKVAILLNAQQRTVEDQLYYNLEYTVEGSTFFRHNLSVYSTSSGLLFSLNAQASESDWKSVQSDFVEIANSFKLLL